jgi:hypoxanthine phosphoribosyltransferase
MTDDISVLLTEKQIQEKVSSLAHDISNHYRGRELIIVSVLKGAFVFTSDLVRALSIPSKIDFVQISSYGMSKTSSGEMTIKKDIDEQIKEKDVLIVEDVVDYGYTMDFLIKHLKQKKPKSVEICALLDKSSRRKVNVQLSYVGFEIPDVFVVGYGLDRAEEHRNLRYVGSFTEKN